LDEEEMEIKEYYQQYFKPSPLGIKAIIVLYGIAVVSDLIDLIFGFSLGGVVGLILSILLFLGFLLRWEIVRVLSRFFIGLFTTVAMYLLLTSEKFRITAKENAIWWSISLVPSVIVFFYLGTKKVKLHFKHHEKTDQQTINLNETS
jgi:hypothetical protein